MVRAYCGSPDISGFQQLQTDIVYTIYHCHLLPFFGSLLGRPHASSSCSCCPSSWQLRFGQAPRIMPVNSAGRSLGGAAPPYRLAIRRPSRPRRHHASPRGSITRAAAARAAARPVHFQHDSTRSFTISQKLQERSPRNFRSGTVVRKRRKSPTWRSDLTLGSGASRTYSQN